MNQLIKRALTCFLVIAVAGSMLSACSKPEKPAKETPSQAEKEKAENTKTESTEPNPSEGRSANPALLDPSLANEQAPAVFRVRFTTSAGDFVVEATREWAPNGVDRLYNLVKIGYFQDIAAFRVLTGFMAQFGMHGDPKVNSIWGDANIADDPVKQSNTRGMLTFAMAGPNTRSTQFFINFDDNHTLDGQGFSPIGKVIEGMETIDKFYSKYGEGAPQGRGPSQMLIASKGNDYLKKQYPKLDYIISAEIL